MKISLRPAGVDDAPAIARVKLETWRHAYAGILPRAWLDGQSLEKKIEQQREHLGRAGQVRIVAEANQKVVGYAAVGFIRVPMEGYPAEFYGLYVLPAFQRMGIGTSLVDKGRRWLKEQVPGPVIVWVLEKNPCRSFYVEGGAQLLKQTRQRSYGSSRYTEVAYAWEIPVSPDQ